LLALSGTSGQLYHQTGDDQVLIEVDATNAEFVLKIVDLLAAVLRFDPDDTIDIGASSSTYRPKNIYAAGFVQPAGGYKSSDGSAGITQTISIEDNNGTIHTLTLKDGVLTVYSTA
jgi:hypothetical protein